MRTQWLIALTCLTLALGGCATKRPPPAPPSSAQEPAPGGGGEGGAATSGVNEGTAAMMSPGAEGVVGPQEGLLAKRLVYFDFDRADIRPDQTELVAAHARYLASHASARVRLEGHTDDRGTREYNIGLGERRAQAVRHALLLQGVADGQVTTVSYGAERPAVAGNNEAAWAQNRRVEIVYLAQ